MRITTKNWRTYSTLKHALPAKAVRSRFLDYFVQENQHQYVKSSPVQPQFDSSIPFVNAGMCQFKRVFTGEETIDYSRVANTQKCIRVGGKHNDLNLVGTDSFHHTFFEMLGNWSFGSYSKKEACAHAWQLLTSSPFSIPAHRLFVTYFGGERELNLPADEEVREIWLELGVHPDRILPFSMKYNFWEMGFTGPCGSCTEVHAALTDEISCRSDLVNGGNPLLAELWNIVFIKYNKTGDSIEKLPCEFIDTGMGFERLVSLLQHKTSNYDTDLFQHMFRTIEKESDISVTKCPAYAGSFDRDNLDTAYRRLADFSRMVTIAISDDVFPDVNAKLRRVLRKALHIAASDFKQESPETLVVELVKNVVESLHETFPEVENNFDKVKIIIEDEALLIDNLTISNEFYWKSLRTTYPILEKFSFTEYPGLPGAYNYLMKNLKRNSESESLTPQMILLLYQTYGLDRSVVKELAAGLNCDIDWDSVKQIMDETKALSKMSLKSNEKFELILRKLCIKTDDSWKHKYTRKMKTNLTAEYIFPDLPVTILAILRNGDIKSLSSKEKIPEELKTCVHAELSLKNEEIGLIFDKTNLSLETEHKRYDKGWVIINDKSFPVSRLEKYHDFIVHYIQLEESVSVILKAGMRTTLRLDSERRLNIMRNNVLAHLMLGTLQKMFPLVYLQYDNTEDSFVNLRLCVHGPELNLKETATHIENQFRSYIKDGLPVEKTIVSSKSDLLNLPGLKLRPAWIYPAQNIQVISVSDKAGNIIVREPSEDVHVQNMSDLEDCTILFLEKVGEHILSVTGFTGAKCKEAIKFNAQIELHSNIFKNRVHFIMEESCPEKALEMSEHAQIILYELIKMATSNYTLISLESSRIMKSVMRSQMKLCERVNQIPTNSVVKFLKTIFREQAARQKLVVYVSLLDVESFKYREFMTKLISSENIPTLFITYRHKKFRAYCHVPQSYSTEDFNSVTWLRSTMDKTEIPCRVVVDEESYPGFTFLSHMVVKTYQIDDVRKSILTHAIYVYTGKVLFIQEYVAENQIYNYSFLFKTQIRIRPFILGNSSFKKIGTLLFTIDANIPLTSQAKINCNLELAIQNPDFIKGLLDKDKDIAVHTLMRIATHYVPNNEIVTKILFQILPVFFAHLHMNKERGTAVDLIRLFLSKETGRNHLLKKWLNFFQRRKGATVTECPNAKLVTMGYDDLDFFINFAKYLKYKKLHKYTYFFSNITYAQFKRIQNDENVIFDLENEVSLRPITTGARGTIQRMINDLFNRESNLRKYSMEGYFSSKTKIEMAIDEIPKILNSPIRSHTDDVLTVLLVASLKKLTEAVKKFKNDRQIGERLLKVVISAERRSYFGYEQKKQLDKILSMIQKFLKNRLENREEEPPDSSNIIGPITIEEELEESIKRMELYLSSLVIE